jgi:putative tricarboxylic transport membrane protein
VTTKDKSYIADFLLAAGLFGVSIVIYAETLKLKPSPYEPLGPAALPRALSVALVLLAIPVIIQGIKKVRGYKPVDTQETAVPASTDEETPEPELKAPPKGPQRPLLSLLTGITTVVYIFAIQLIGFRISTVVLLLFLGTMLYRRERKMRPVTFFPTLIVLALGMSQLLYFIFTRILVVNLP